jgi:hypothetical protein
MGMELHCSRLDEASGAFFKINHFYPVFLCMCFNYSCSRGGIIIKFEPLPPAIYYSSAHQLSQVCGRPSNLRKGQAAFNALKILAGNLIAHNMTLLSIM